jgi:hypothetical protein
VTLARVNEEVFDMITTTAPPRQRAPVERRRAVRLLAAALATLVSMLYFLIGFRVLTVIQDPEGQTGFGLTAGVAFLIGAVVIMVVDRRFVWTLGALTQAFIIFTYFNLASVRVPEFETWGIAIRVLQTLLFGALVYLAIRPSEQAQSSLDGSTDRARDGVAT